MGQIISVIKNFNLDNTANSIKRFGILDTSNYNRDLYVKNLSIVPVNSKNVLISLILTNQDSEAYLVQDVYLSHDDPLYLKNLYLSIDNKLFLEVKKTESSEFGQGARVDVIVQCVLL